MPETCRAELIKGIVYVAAALWVRSYGQPHRLLNAGLTTYRIAALGMIIAAAPTVRLDAINEPQPDLALLIDSE